LYSRLEFGQPQATFGYLWEKAPAVVPVLSVSVSPREEILIRGNRIAVAAISPFTR
jgi:hypothetical protein